MEPEIFESKLQSLKESREKSALRLQVRLIAWGAIGSCISDDSEVFAYAEYPWRIFNKILSEVYGCKPLFKSINMAVEEMYNKGIRAIKPE